MAAVLPQAGVARLHVGAVQDPDAVGTVVVRFDIGRLDPGDVQHGQAVQCPGETEVAQFDVAGVLDIHPVGRAIALKQGSSGLAVGTAVQLQWLGIRAHVLTVQHDPGGIGDRIHPRVHVHPVARPDRIMLQQVLQALERFGRVRAVLDDGIPVQSGAEAVDIPVGAGVIDIVVVVPGLDGYREVRNIVDVGVGLVDHPPVQHQAQRQRADIPGVLAGGGQQVAGDQMPGDFVVRGILQPDEGVRGQPPVQPVEVGIAGHDAGFVVGHRPQPRWIGLGQRSLRGVAVSPDVDDAAIRLRFEIPRPARVTRIDQGRQRRDVGGRIRSPGPRRRIETSGRTALMEIPFNLVGKQRFQHHAMTIRRRGRTPNRQVVVVIAAARELILFAYQGAVDPGVTIVITAEIIGYISNPRE